MGVWDICSREVAIATGHDGIHSPIPPELFKDVAIQKDEGVQRLVLCGRRHTVLHCKRFKKSLYFGAAYAGEMLHSVKADEEAYPVAVSFLGMWSLAFHTHGGLHSLHQLRRLAVRIHMALLTMHGYAYRIIGSGKARKRANSE